MKKLPFALTVMAALAIALGGPGEARAQDEDEGPMSNMRFVVVRDASGKPVKNAAVVLHPVTRKGKQSMGGLELKTDEEGKTWIDGIPYGVLRVQVLAPGFQTFGEDYEIRQPETQITVRLKRPTQQYSVYGASDKDKGKDKKTDPAPPSPQAQPQGQQPPPPEKAPDHKPQ
ncbi:MAG TPA: carboxypeptidase-like regulatory domain-containing protein [Terriglobales bacterium]|nr:carboxypeptidase-like regulatory domain-containing protein [Terriglobales bacterium]